MALNVILLTKSLPISGASRVFRAQAEWFAGKGYKVFIFVQELNREEKFFPHAGVNIVTEVDRLNGIGNGIAVSHHPATFESLRQLNSFEYRIQYFQSVASDIGWSYVDEHFLDAARSVKEIIFFSTSKYVSEWLNREGICSNIVSPGIDQVFFQRAENKRQNIVLVEGSEKPYKGVNWLCKNIPSKWLIWCVGRKAHNSNRIDRMFIAPTDQKLAWIYSKAKVLVKHSTSEGFGLPLLEAMAGGCAVVCSDMGGNMDYCVNEYNCLFYGNKEELYGCLKRILVDQSLLREIVANGMRVANQYKWDESMADLLNKLEVART